MRAEALIIAVREFPADEAAGDNADVGISFGSGARWRDEDDASGCAARDTPVVNCERGTDIAGPLIGEAVKVPGVGTTVVTGVVIVPDMNGKLYAGDGY